MVELGNTAGTVEVQGALLAGLQVHRGIRVRRAKAAHHLPVVVAEDLRGTLTESATRHAKVVACFSGEPVGLGLLTLLDLLHAGLGRFDVAIEASEDLAALVHYMISIVNAEEGSQTKPGIRDKLNCDNEESVLTVVDHVGVLDHVEEVRQHFHHLVLCLSVGHLACAEGLRNVGLEEVRVNCVHDL